MPKIDPRVDAYIAKSADFAKPILIHVRKLVHEACPDCEETIKWSVPFFDYKGPFCSMAAFKAHCVFGFAKASLLPDPKGILSDKKDEAAGVMGRVTDVKDLPSDKTILSFLKAAKKLNDDGVKVPAKKPEPKKELPVPDYMMKALKKNKKAFFTFEEFSPSHKREYIEWITEAKAEETRQRRMETMIEWLVEGKSRHWKYHNK
ncbi:MAG: YdeI/OmpD-associated family protein [Bacteroidota bacterium]